MSRLAHFKFILYSFSTWLTFYLIGLPDYYQSWPFWAKIILCIAVTALYFPVTIYSLRKFWQDGRHIKNALWLALYLTVPLFIYDYLLIAVHWDVGIQFVFPYWYLSFFYFSFWVQFPLIGYWLEKRSLASGKQ